GHARVGRDAYAVGAGEGLAVAAHDEWAERRHDRVPAVQHLPVAPGPGEDVVEAVEGRRRDIRDAQQGDDDGSFLVRHGTFVRIVARIPLLPGATWVETPVHPARASRPRRS